MPSRTTLRRCIEIVRNGMACTPYPASHLIGERDTLENTTAVNQAILDSIDTIGQFRARCPWRVRASCSSATSACWSRTRDRTRSPGGRLRRTCRPVSVALTAPIAAPRRSSTKSAVSGDMAENGHCLDYPPGEFATPYSDSLAINRRMASRSDSEGLKSGACSDHGSPGNVTIENVAEGAPGGYASSC
jgi:hypothetical protein